jgi:hypothetical protein
MDAKKGLHKKSGGEMSPQEEGHKGKDVTEIICIIDRSGSMESIRSDAIGGFNRFLADQQEPEDPARLTMVLFDDQYEVVHNGTDIHSVPLLTNTTFVPRGSTALLDAVGKTLNTVSARLSEIPVNDRPEKIIVAILTDGHENASREFSLPVIREMISHYSTDLKWDFIYLAATQDAFGEAGKMGIPADNTMQVSASKAGIQDSYQSISMAMEMKRKYNDIKSWKERTKRDPDSGANSP